MSLTGTTTMALAFLLLFLAVIATLALWNRFGRGPSTWSRATRWAARVALVVSSQLSAVIVVAVIANDSGHFYSSWLELLGDHHTVSHPAVPPGNLDKTVEPRLVAARAHDRGVVVSLKIPGTASGIHGFSALVYLPVQYGMPAYSNRDFPVVELIAGSPGTPTTWTDSLHVAGILDTEIAAGRTSPVIAVMPSQDVAGGRDTQCTNVVHGPQVDTYMTDDVRQTIISAFRVQTQARAWSLMGYSSGGFCATNLAMRHPDLYGSAVSIAGYAKPAHDSQTGDLFGNDPTAQNLNTPLWRADHLPPPDVSLLLMSSRADPGTAHDATALAALARPPLLISRVPLAHGGHNFEVWRAEEPVAFGWLSQHMPPPLAPTPVIDHTAPVTGR